MCENNTTKRIVEFGTTFLNYYNNRFSTTTIDKIDDFIEHFEHQGLRGWKGKISSSDKVPASYQIA
jgi:hypothetical protein